MDQKTSADINWDTFFADWISPAKTLWESWNGFFNNLSNHGPQFDSKNPHFDIPENLIRSLFNLMSDSSFFEQLEKAGGLSPELIFKFNESIASSMMPYFEQWLTKIGNIGKASKAYTFENLDENIFKLWEDIYIKEFQKLLHAPQLGLAREYQERFDTLLDKYIIHVLKTSELLRVMWIPIEKSLAVLQNELSLAAEKGEFYSESKTIYNNWIKILEGHYMTLFQSEEYTQKMASALIASNEFKIAKENFLMDILSTLPIATKKDTNELYKEIYLLKKQIKTLKKELAVISK